MNAGSWEGSRRPDTALREPDWSSTASVDRQLVERLYVGPERWGWQFVPPAETESFSAPQPIWQELSEPDLGELEKKLLFANELQISSDVEMPMLPWGAGLIVVGLLFLLGGGGVAAFGLLLLILPGAALIGWASIRKSAARAALDAAKAEAAAKADQHQRAHAKAMDDWQARRDCHDQAERARYESTLLHYPLVLHGEPSRIDVVGGTPAGWAAVLATMGSSALSTGSTMLVLDLSGHDVASGLVRVSAARDGRVRIASIPREIENLGFLSGMDARELSEVLAESFGSTQTQADAADLRVNLLHTVARRLDGKLTLARLLAGVEVLRSTYDPNSDGPLTTRELARLTAYVDDLDRSERVRDELRFIADQLEVLAASTDVDATAQVDELDLWGGGGLTVLCNDARQPRRKGLIDRVLFQLVRHHLVEQVSGPGSPLLVVAGGDGLGRDNLESMVRQAFASRVRLVYLFEHLREDSESLLGSSDSATMIMRLGNAREAAAAADYIGKVHGLKLSQVSRQVGRTITDGGSSSTGGQDGYSRTTGSSETRGHGGWASGSSSSSTENWSKSWQAAKNWSTSDSQADGTTLARSYDLVVEPTVIQGLEPTAFVLVDSRGGERRVVAGDAFPGMVLVDRVSPRPLEQ